MDIKVYQKEEVKQPSGSEFVYVPDVIDLIPELTTDENGIEYVVGCDILNDDDKSLLEQQCALATIYQKGLDPLDEEDGIRWSEAMLDEINPVQLMDDIQAAVAKVTTAVTVEFDTIQDAKGNSYLTYTLKGVA